MVAIVESPSTPVPIRVFVASPGDVADERALAFSTLEALRNDPLLEGRLALQVVAWDRPAASVPLLAGQAPQDAIFEQLPTPAECDIFVLILWSRIGTVVDPSSQAARGAEGLTGTLTEYRKALEASRSGRPRMLIYRRTAEPPRPSLTDPAGEEHRSQWSAVQAFFGELRTAQGAFRDGYNEYAGPSEFARLLDSHLRYVLRDLLGLSYLGRGRLRRPSVECPFPGLLAFTGKERDRFFGRGVETDELVRRVVDPASRLTAVVGASGVGKSSVVAAGLIPRLRGIVGDAAWMYVTCAPGDSESGDPFESLAFAIEDAIGRRRAFRPRQFAASLAADPSSIGAAWTTIATLATRPPGAELFVFIDQFEELFTFCDPSRIEPFVELLRAAIATERVRIVVTLRADFYARCTEYSGLATLLRSGSFPLAPPDAAAMVEMIRQPAEQAGLEFDADLPGRIMGDMGADRAALPLLAFALRKLWELRDPTGQLTTAAYQSLGGVRGVIGTTAEQVFNSLETGAQDSLATVFTELVALHDAEGQPTVTRRKVPLRAVTTTPGASQLVDALVAHRLLVTDRNSQDQPVVSVAHEALLSNWSRLASWIAHRQDDLRLIQMIRAAAADWNRYHRADEFFWSQKRLTDARSVVSQLQPHLSDLERRFLGLGDAAQLIDELGDGRTGHRRREFIGDRLAEQGDTRRGVGLRDDGVPDLVWCRVPAGPTIVLPPHVASALAEGAPQEVVVGAFEISTYPITWRQFQAFIDHPQGYMNAEWWEGLKRAEPGTQQWAYGNCTAENVSWYDAVAFCRWLSAVLDEHIQLPSESQWVRAAGGGLDAANVPRYPWGIARNSQQANTRESGLSRPIAVGMYPQAASPFGVQDLAGNVYEWCRDEYDDPSRRVGGDGPRVIKGGAWSFDMAAALVLPRERDLPDFREYHDHGFRVVRTAVRDASEGGA